MWDKFRINIEGVLFNVTIFSLASSTQYISKTTKTTKIMSDHSSHGIECYQGAGRKFIREQGERNNTREKNEGSERKNLKGTGRK